ncbi:hypothetical protein CWI39_0020p0010 [Hamiltosporidium magnivora]|uniref:Uncharacterized protein n=1 Tax=Hamiltosporidium magnivora TaxID=148818 RepID=A0A4Q9LQM6_9MICR|nr:hypothetical protein CWI36_0480p0050 [Hamiltosporidium magnivora]TBU09901.1 hypothetical protein CWI39_0020p0010 [Hamiltosporidium magnivora]
MKKLERYVWSVTVFIVLGISLYIIIKQLTPRIGEPDNLTMGMALTEVYNNSRKVKSIGFDFCKMLEDEKDKTYLTEMFNKMNSMMGLQAQGSSKIEKSNVANLRTHIYKIIVYLKEIESKQSKEGKVKLNDLKCAISQEIASIEKLDRFTD